MEGKFSLLFPIPIIFGVPSTLSRSFAAILITFQFWTTKDFPEKDLKLRKSSEVKLR